MKLTYEFPVDIVSDTKWRYAASARPGRGLHDYERTIVFTRKLGDYESKKLLKLLYEIDNPGYCNWSFKTQDNVTFRITSTMDSSD